MRTLWNYSNYGNDLRLTRNDAHFCTHSGTCDNEVLATMQKPYVKKQLAKLDAKQLVKELSDYGAWDNEQLANHDENLMRWVWISAGDIVDGKP